jgi:glycosyltransferase involved in cell wall biosynthesis
LTVGFHAPLPPARTGVADYAAALLGALRRRGTVKSNSRRADVHLYHLGNNRLHHEIYSRALRQPGVVVLHDAVLHHLLLGTLDEASYVEEFVHNYGEWGRDLGTDLWRERKRSGADPRYFQYAMVRRIAEASRAVIVHNPAAAGIVRAHASAAHVVEIPHLFIPPRLPVAAETVALRLRLGLSPRTFLFGVFGYLRDSKRLPAVLRVFSELRASGLDVSLLVAGEFVSPDLARAVQELMRQPGILRAGYVPEREFWALEAAVDACVSLRYPAAGETSGIAIRLMGIGKPVILSEGKENSRFPEAACLRVGAGIAERRLLTEYMMWLARFPGDAHEIGRRAETYVRGRHNIDAVADSYWETLRACTN